MRHFRMLIWLAPLALLAAIAGVVAAFCGGDPKPVAAAAIKLSGQATGGVISGDHFYTVADGQLVGADLKKGDATVFSECYRRYPKLRPFVDVADGKACVASEGEIHVIDLAGGQILHSAKYKGEVHGLGFAGDDRVFVIGDKNVVVLNVASGETVSATPLWTENSNRARPDRGADPPIRGSVNSSMWRTTPPNASRSWTWKPARSLTKWAAAMNGSLACRWPATRRSCAAST